MMLAQLACRASNISAGGKAAQESNHQAQIFHGLGDRTQDASLVSIGARAKVPPRQTGSPAWMACMPRRYSRKPVVLM